MKVQRDDLRLWKPTQRNLLCQSVQINMRLVAAIHWLQLRNTKQQPRSSIGNRIKYTLNTDHVTQISY